MSSPRDVLIADLRARGWSQRAIAREVGLSQPAVKHILDAQAGRPRVRTGPRVRSEHERMFGNASRRNTPCTVCGKLCWGRSRRAPIPGHVCVDCRAF